MTDEQAYERIVDIVFKYEEKELPLLEDRNLNIEALNHIREALKKANMRGEDIKVFVDSTPTVLTIPDNPTNGDMIKALFPYIEPKFYKNMSDMYTVYIKIDDKVYGDMYNIHTFSTDWWNAPYKRDDEEWR